MNLKDYDHKTAHEVAEKLAEKSKLRDEQDKGPLPREKAKQLQNTEKRLKDLWDSNQRGKGERDTGKGTKYEFGK